MLLFMDGMSHYGSADLAKKYSGVGSGPFVWSVVAEGRYGNCLKRVATDWGVAGGSLTVAPFATRDGLWTPNKGGVCGFAIKVDDLTRIVSSSILELYEGDHRQLYLELNPSGTFTLRAYHFPTAGDTLAESIEGLVSNTWMYLECRWYIDRLVGTFELRLNTIPILTYSGDTTSYMPEDLELWTNLQLFTLAATVVGQTVRVCDLYVADLVGGAGAVTDFLGDGTVVTIFPDGPGLAAGWTPSGGANWDMVNDKPAPDGDATYVEAIAPGLRDCHEFENIPASATVLGVHYNMLVRKLDEGSLTLKPIVGQGGVQFEGPTQGASGLAYDRYLTQPYDVNPATGAPWTAAEINAGQWGLLKVT